MFEFNERVFEYQELVKDQMKVSLDNKNIGVEGVGYLAVALKTNYSLVELSMRSNNIGIEGARLLNEVLQVNNTLTKLDLFKNQIGDEGARYLTEALSINNGLTDLDLKYNYIGVEGAGSLAEVLKINRTLKIIDLSNNNIGASGALYLGEALKGNNKLTKLALSWNNIGEGAGSLADALKSNQTLTELNLSDNKIGAPVALMFAEALKDNHTLTQLKGIDLNKYLGILLLPREFACKDNYEILSYLKELHQSRSQPPDIFRMRVMVVGPGNAGKTTLVHRILTGEFKSGQFGMTDGILMNEWKPNENHRVQLSLWDFGGQEVYLNTHSMLFSDQTLYLLVWDPRAGTPFVQLEDYLLNIRSKSKTSPIMLVTTHSSEVKSIGSLNGLLRDLGKYNYVRHYSIDSRDGSGINELSRGLIDFVSHDEECVKYSRVLVPGWYLSLENRLRDIQIQSDNNRIFFLSRNEFNSFCQSLWKSNSQIQADEIQGESAHQINTVLTLFHHWGIIYVLPQTQGDHGIYEGDIILSPQKLANVLKCVITCNSKTITTHSNIGNISDNDGRLQRKLKELFEEGILSHYEEVLGFVWSEYQSRLHVQFLKLLHDNELAYEIFNEDGESTNQSLIPCLLCNLGVERMKEKDIREMILNERNQPQNQILHQCYVNVKFDCLLPNFLPKLMVRLRHLIASSSSLFAPDTETEHNKSIPFHSRHHFVLVIENSVCCVVEDRLSQSLILYPGLNSICANLDANTNSNFFSLSSSLFDATAICNSAIRGFLDDSFSGLKVEEVVLSIESEIFRSEKILACLTQNLGRLSICSSVPPSASSSTRDAVTFGFSMNFLTPLFDPLLLKPTSMMPSRESTESDLISPLRQKLAMFQEQSDLVNRLGLSHSFISFIPLFRERLLTVSPSPSIMWLVGEMQNIDNSLSNPDIILMALSPNIDPCSDWELVPDTQITLSPSQNVSSSSHLSDIDLFFACLKCLLPNGKLLIYPEVKWIGYLSSDISPCHSCFSEMKTKEQNFFIEDKDLFGDVVYYANTALKQQRMNLVEEMKALLRGEMKIMKDVMIEGLGGVKEKVEDVKDTMGDVALMIQSDLSRIEETSQNNLVSPSSSQQNESRGNWSFAWNLLKNPSKIHPTTSVGEIEEYLNNLGVSEAEELVECKKEEIEKLSSFLKPIQSRKFLKVFSFGF